MPLVSVLIPFYNAENTIEVAVNSIIEQTYADMEIVLVNDGSTDKSLNMIEHLSQSDRRIKVITTKNTGIVSALNFGLSHCDSKYIARMDADDISHADRIRKQVEWLEENPKIDILGTQVEGFPAPLKGIGRYIAWQNALIDHDDITREIFIESPLTHPSVMMKRDILHGIGGYQDNGWAEDYDLWLRLFIQRATFYKLPEVLLRWREHDMRLTRIDSRYSVENFIRAKAVYLTQSYLVEKREVIIWGAGMMGRRLSKHLQRNGVPIIAFLDINPKKFGSVQRGIQIYNYTNLPELVDRNNKPFLLASVASRGARQSIRNHLNSLGYIEGIDWVCTT